MQRTVLACLHKMSRKRPNLYLGQSNCSTRKTHINLQNKNILPSIDPVGRSGASPPRKGSLDDPEYILTKRVANIEAQERQKSCGNFEERLKWQNNLLAVGYTGPAPVLEFDRTEDCPAPFPLAPSTQRFRPDFDLDDETRKRKQEDTIALAQKNKLVKDIPRISAPAKTSHTTSTSRSHSFFSSPSSSSSSFSSSSSSRPHSLPTKNLAKSACGTESSDRMRG